MLDNLLNILMNGKDKLFYKINDKKITYIECYKEVIELSNILKRQGNLPVILYGHKSINQVISILACIVSNRCYIPIDIYTPKNRIEEIINNSHASLIIKNEEIEINNIECLSIKELKNKYINNKEYNTTTNDIAYIIFTSGSTGTSKGVPITYNNLNNFIKWIINENYFKDCHDLKVLSTASFSFDLSVMDLYFSLYKEASIIGIDKDTKNNISSMYKIIKDNKINFLIMTPTLVKMLLLDNNFNTNNYKNIKYMFFCGEPLETITAKKIINRFPNINLINAYGPTEATCCISLVKIDNNMLDYDYLPVGLIDRAAVNVDIINNEIVLKGDSVFNNYLNINSNNCYKENNINCYKTGDIGYIDNNYLYCKGRIDNQIKYQGYRIELGDIENNLLKISGIKEAVVICKYKDNSNIVRLIKAFVTIENNIDEDKIKSELEKMLPNYMIPKSIIILDKIPVNNNGKYDRKKLESI